MKVHKLRPLSGKEYRDYDEARNDERLEAYRAKREAFEKALQEEHAYYDDDTVSHGSFVAKCIAWVLFYGVALAAVGWLSL